MSGLLVISADCVADPTGQFGAIVTIAKRLKIPLSTKFHMGVAFGFGGYDLCERALFRLHESTISPVIRPVYSDFNRRCI